MERICKILIMSNKCIYKFVIHFPLAKIWYPQDSTFGNPSSHWQDDALVGGLGGAAYRPLHQVTKIWVGQLCLKFQAANSSATSSHNILS